MKRMALALVVLSAAASSASAQSFNCEDRLSRDEQAICDSRVLSRLDVEMSEVFQEVLAGSRESERRQIQDEQRDWISARRSCGERASCLKRLYLDRISELEDALENSDHASRPRDANDGDSRWAALGSVRAGDFLEPLSILVGFSRGRFDALQLRARDADARVRRVTVFYGNGARQSFSFRRGFRAGQLSDRIELRANRAGRFLERIEIEAQSRGGARIDVIGRRSEDARLPESGVARYDERYLDDGGRFGDRDTDRFEDRDLRDGGRSLDDRGDDYRYEERVFVSRDRFLEFVKTVFHRTAEMSADELRETYAEQADYYGERRKPVEEIIADKHNYAQRWTDRAFRVRDDSFRFEETAKSGVYQLTYTYDFHVRGDGRESKGTGESTLWVDTNGERYVITKEDGKVLNRL